MLKPAAAERQPRSYCDQLTSHPPETPEVVCEDRHPRDTSWITVVRSSTTDTPPYMQWAIQKRHPCETCAFFFLARVDRNNLLYGICGPSSGAR